MTTELNRRRVLIGLAAASGAAACASVGEAARAQETSELIELGNALPEVEALYWTARKRVDAIVQDVSPIWPKAPE